MENKSPAPQYESRRGETKYLKLVREPTRAEQGWKKTPGGLEYRITFDSGWMIPSEIVNLKK